MGDFHTQPDIAERLREGVNGQFENYALRIEAADRIEELTKALERARVSLNAVAMTTDSVSFQADVEAIDRTLAVPLEGRGGAT